MVQEKAVREAEFVKVPIEFTAWVTDPDGNPPRRAAGFSEHIDRWTEGLISLGAEDPFVGADLDEGVVEISLSVEGQDDVEASARATTLIRAAIHAAGGAAPSWERGWHVRNIARAEAASA